MGFLPGVLFALALLKLSSGAEGDQPSPFDATAGQSPHCPGVCQKSDSCLTQLSETDCSEDLICCVDHLEKVATTEFDDSDMPAESALDSNIVHEVETDEVPEESEFSEVVIDEENLFDTMPIEEVEVEEGFQYEGDQMEMSNDGSYQIMYSPESEETVLSSAQEESYQETYSGCPGTCVPSEYTSDCSYIINDDGVCSTGATCCLTEEDMERTKYAFEYVEEKPSSLAKRSTDNLKSRYNCPGTCVHPSHALYCKDILNRYSCPLNTKCCIFPTSQRNLLPEPKECLGMCIPFHMSGYCLPPNELVIGPTSCPAEENCCMRNALNVKPPLFSGMSFPSSPQQSNAELTANILGHLAVDEAGTVFKVSKAGQVSPLLRMPPGSNLRNFVRLATYPRPDGELVIYADKIGTLYQEFYPRMSSIGDSRLKAQSPLLRQPIRQFESQASEQATKFKPPSNTENSVPFDTNAESSDIVIPDDDDEAPVTTNTPVVHSDKNSRPPCPGSCMSYFLRFTCFRGYAIYDGFSCPGRAVCCARLKDIEDHEQYLKSLSPYFNVPPASRDSVTLCGIKGRRDTPRVMGGKDSLPGEWCWQVAVINVQNQYICGGALIDNSWVVTAAHCVSGPMEESQALFIRAGVTDLKSAEDNSKAQTIRVLSTFLHHNFNSQNLDNNIALLRLQKPVELNSNTCVVCLPTSRKMPEDGSKCTVTGYGFVSPDGDMALRIREAKVPIIDDMECMTNITEELDNPFILPASSFCAGGEGQTDACQGDAGGALVCEIGGFHELVGLVSWGLGCGKSEVPSIYVKIPAFMGWINQIISSSSFVLP